MYKYIIIIFTSIVFIVTYVIFRNKYDYIETLPPTNYSSNMPMRNYSQNLYVNPEEYSELEDTAVKENEYSGIQPEELYFDIFDITCAQPYKRPSACLLLKGNYVNNIPKKYCKKVCPEVENFTNFEKNPKPSYYYCYNSCKNKCEKHKYNPLEPYKNTCGENGLSQVPLEVYLSEEKCLANTLPCDKLSKDKCLKNPQCGWCTNGIGKGMCFRSTPEGTFNLELPCQPSRVKPTNSFTPGRLNPFEGVVQFQPIKSFQKNKK